MRRRAVLAALLAALPCLVAAQAHIVGTVDDSLVVRAARGALAARPVLHPLVGALGFSISARTSTTG